MKRFTMQDSSGDYDWMFTNAPYDPNMSPDDVEKWIGSLIDIEIEIYRSDLEQRAESLAYPRFGYTTADVYETSAEWLAAKIEELEEDIEIERGNMRQEIAQWLEREAAKRSPVRFRHAAEYGYVASHNQGRTLVLSDGRVFEERRDQWYLSDEGVDPDSYTREAVEDWNADWTEIDPEGVARYIDPARDYYIGEPPRN